MLAAEKVRHQNRTPFQGDEFGHGNEGLAVLAEIAVHLRRVDEDQVAHDEGRPKRAIEKVEIFVRSIERQEGEDLVDFGNEPSISGVWNHFELSGNWTEN